MNNNHNNHDKNKPFSHLGANFNEESNGVSGGKPNHKVYRAKAPSNVWVSNLDQKVSSKLIFTYDFNWLNYRLTDLSDWEVLK